MQNYSHDYKVYERGSLSQGYPWPIYNYKDLNCNMVLTYIFCICMPQYGEVLKLKL